MPITGQTLSVRDLSDRWGVEQHHVLKLVRAAALAAFDISLRPGTGKPRWRIPLAAVEAFESRRAVRPQEKATRRKRREMAGIRSFY